LPVKAAGMFHGTFCKCTVSKPFFEAQVNLKAPEALGWCTQKIIVDAPRGEGMRYATLAICVHMSWVNDVCSEHMHPCGVLMCFVSTDTTYSFGYVYGCDCCPAVCKTFMALGTLRLGPACRKHTKLYDYIFSTIV
jgi:hypothetical protein